VDQNLADMKGCLASGYPFVFGFAAYQSSESDDVSRTGIVPRPGPSGPPSAAMPSMAVGYDATKSMFIIRNSWGPSWGIGGYCYMPYAYLLDDNLSNLSNDFWTIRIVD
jgi:C1A family cysteine protease